MCNDPFSIKREPEKVIWWNKYIRGKQLTGVLRVDTQGCDSQLSDHIFEIKDITV